MIHLERNQFYAEQEKIIKSVIKRKLDKKRYHAMKEIATGYQDPPMKKIYGIDTLKLIDHLDMHGSLPEPYHGMNSTRCGKELQKVGSLP